MKRIQKTFIIICFTILCTILLSASALAANDTPAQVKKLKASAGESSVTLKWKKVSKATGYYIYQVDTSGKTQKLGKTKKNSYTVKKLTNGKKYTFTVCAYRTAKSKTYTGAMAKKVTVTPMVKKPSKPKPYVSACANGSATLTWKKVSGASGYQVFQANSSGKYELLGTVKKTSVAVTNLTNNITYKFKVRAFRRVSGVVRYGSYSSVVTAKPMTLSAEIKSVQSMTYKAKVTRTLNAPLVANGRATSKTVTVKAGTSVTVTYYSVKDCTVQLSNKTKVVINRDDLSITGCVYDSHLDYSDAAKEGFINRKGYSSYTNYLIWISLYRQRLYIFRGSKGSWKLIRNMQCSSGKGETATTRGQYMLWKKERRFQFDDYSYGDYPCYFSDNAIHSWVKLGSPVYGYTGQLVNDGKLGAPASHGCVRVTDENILFIYNMIPMYSTIIIY